MTYQIENDALFNIKTTQHAYVSYGGDQEWYKNIWHKKAGCGPTSAANLTAYLAMTRPSYNALYPELSSDQAVYTQHMDRLFKYVTPGLMGVNHIDKFTSGVKNYALDLGLSLEVYSLVVEKNTLGERRVDELIDFVKKGLSEDSPIAFLNLSSGAERKLYPWHWITITSVEINGKKVIATASDEGYKKTFDLSLWYVTTPMHGGLVYLL